MFSLVKKPIERAIKKANRQIKQTKEYFGLKDGAGLLLLANDGNYSFESNHIISIASKILSTQYSGIDGFVYFTANMRAMMPGYERDVNLWIPKLRWIHRAVSRTRRPTWTCVGRILCAQNRARCTGP